MGESLPVPDAEFGLHRLDAQLDVSYLENQRVMAATGWQSSNIYWNHIESNIF